jgi:hypothetical protein
MWSFTLKQSAASRVRVTKKLYDPSRIPMCEARSYPSVRVLIASTAAKSLRVKTFLYPSSLVFFEVREVVDVVLSTLAR